MALPTRFFHTSLLLILLVPGVASGQDAASDPLGSEIHRAVDDLVRMLRDSIGEPVLHP